MILLELMQQMNTIIWSWPLIVYVIGVSIFCTVALKGIQFTAFTQAWKEALFPKKDDGHPEGGMSPLQAFMNTLSANLGNSALAGVATAIYAGGPGAAIWAIIISLLLMAVRFSEVYISTEYGAKSPPGTTVGGPMLYLKSVPCGNILAWTYGFFCFLFGNTIGNAMQINSIRVSIETTWGINKITITAFLLAFVGYVLFGGADRIVKMSERIVPIKVIVFFFSSLAVLVYNFTNIPHAFSLMLAGAFSPTAFAGGVLGFTVQQAMRFGIDRSIMATESGLGTAAILFGFTGKSDPLKSGLMGMLSTFISALVCFIVALCVVASGAWDTGLTSTALTIKAFSSTFGAYAGWIVSFLSVTFGIGVVVAFAYITRATWLFLTGGRWEWVSFALFALFTAFGSMVDADVVFTFGGIVNAGLLVINLFGVAWLTPAIAQSLAQRKIEA